jgi:hypothetical protein
MHVRSDVLREYVLIITSSMDNCIDNADTVFMNRLQVCKTWLNCHVAQEHVDSHVNMHRTGIRWHFQRTVCVNKIEVTGMWELTLHNSLRLLAMGR